MGSDEGTAGRAGAYYWLPRPGGPGPTWDLITCHDLGRGAAVGHAALWPVVAGRLAEAWGRTPATLARRLRDHHAGLPRGRVTRVRGVSLVHHGGDAPSPGGLDEIEARFGLRGRPVRRLLDDHERMLAGDPEAVQAAIGIDLGLRGVEPED